MNIIQDFFKIVKPYSTQKPIDFNFKAGQFKRPASKFLLKEYEIGSSGINELLLYLFLGVETPFHCRKLSRH